MNIALCYVLLEQRTESWWLRSVGAGMIAPLIRRAVGTVEWVDTAGFPLGSLVTQSYRETVTELYPGDVLVMLSDGIVEVMSADRELFGFERLAHTLAAIDPACGAQQIMAALLDAVHAHGAGVDQHDDMTLVVVRVLGGTLTNSR
jgi:serine phosphatase RsbU (regulator of sigma subunit)